VRRRLKASRSARLPTVTSAPVSITPMALTDPICTGTRMPRSGVYLKRTTACPGRARVRCERITLMRSLRNSMVMRLLSSPSPPSTPSAPPKASATIGTRVFSTTSSPNSIFCRRTAEAIAVPVTPLSRTASRSTGTPRSSTTRWTSAERLAPVSSTSR
jgi:hypothetical protein